MIVQHAIQSDAVLAPIFSRLLETDNHNQLKTVEIYIFSNMLSYIILKIRESEKS